MAILIPNMEMPDTCADCLLEYDSMLCRVLSEGFYDKEHFDFTVERLPNCPLQDFYDVMQNFFEVIEKKTYEALSTSKHPACKGTFNKAELESLIEKIGANPYPEERCP